MRTTLDLDDALLKKARRRAIEEHKSLTRVIEDSLRRYLLPPRNQRRRFAEYWRVERGAGPAAVDVADRDRLYDLLGYRR